MISLTASTARNSWENAGRRSASLVATQSIILVAGDGAHATARLAIGLARELEQSRRAVLMDIWGDLPDIRDLVPNSDIHGIADHFAFGVSLGQLERPVPDSSNLQVITSGTDDIAQRDLLERTDWLSVFHRYRTANTLLVMVARAETPGLTSLSTRVDGTIVVGEASEEGLFHVIGRVKRTIPSLPPRITPRSAAALPSAEKDSSSPWQSVHRSPAPVMLALAVLGALTLVLLRQPRDGGESLLARLMSRVSPSQPSTLVPDTLPRAPVAANPRDSAGALAYAVEIATFNSAAGAAMRAADLRDVVGSTVTPMLSPTGESWFVVFAGAFRTKEEAEALQSQLRNTGVQLADVSRVVQLPYALELAAQLSPETASGELARYISLDVPAYALQQADGSVTIYAGAFATGEQSVPLSEMFAAQGMTSRLVYRTGR